MLPQGLNADVAEQGIGALDEELLQRPVIDHLWNIKVLLKRSPPWLVDILLIPTPAHLADTNNAQIVIEHLQHMKRMIIRLV